MANLIENFIECENIPDYHSVYSIQLCELINDGWIDFSDESWDFDSYNEEQRNRHLIWCHENP